MGVGGAGERADLATPRIQGFGPPASSFRDTKVQATAPPSTDIRPGPNPLLPQTPSSFRPTNLNPSTFLSPQKAVVARRLRSKGGAHLLQIPWQAG